MNRFFYSVFRFLHYRLTASHRCGHGIHSPLIYDFVRNVLIDKKLTDLEKENRKLFRQLKGDRRTLIIHDLGTGSKATKRQVSVAYIASHSTTREKYRFLLGRMVRYYQFPVVIELGTSLGLTTHLFSKSTQGQVITVEGAENLAKLAQENLTKWQCNNCQVLNQPFDRFLEQLPEISAPTMIYIDGNHTCEATLRYFSVFEKRVPAGSIVVLGDIYWSEGMTKAWETICQNKENRYLVDIYGLGLVFFHSRAQGQYVKISY